jgi:hypothetical protein
MAAAHTSQVPSLELHLGWVDGDAEAQQGIGGVPCGAQGKPEGATLGALHEAGAQRMPPTGTVTRGDCAEQRGACFELDRRNGFYSPFCGSLDGDPAPAEVDHGD